MIAKNSLVYSTIRSMSIDGYLCGVLTSFTFWALIRSTNLILLGKYTGLNLGADIFLTGSILFLLFMQKRLRKSSIELIITEIKLDYLNELIKEIRTKIKK